MTPQSSFTLVAPVAPGRVEPLRAVLAGMNLGPGRVDPRNALVPFGAFDRIHFARLVVLDDATAGDVATAYGGPAPALPTYLAFLVDCDGDADATLAELARRAGDGLRRIFAHCEGFDAGADLLPWMRAHLLQAAALYVNWLGRTVRQVREEASLRDLLRTHLDAHAAELGGRPAREVRDALRAAARAALDAGRLTLTPEEPTPLGWRVRDTAHLLGVPLAALLLSPVLLAALPFFLIQLRRHEGRDPEIAPPVDPAHARRLGALEDHDVTNQFSAMGTLKPGAFRRLAIGAAFAILDYTTRHVYARGHLARVSTIHFARWVYLPDRRRLLFASNYDGSLESYMDDFINKVAFGLNLVFSNGVGYPSTRWLVLDGAKDEQKFKWFIRRHELPTEVWYDAHPGLTAPQLARHTAIRRGLEAERVSEADAAQWLALL